MTILSFYVMFCNVNI